MGKVVKRHAWIDPIIKPVGIMNQGSSDPYAGRDNMVKLVIATVAMVSSGLVAYAFYVSGFNPYAINASTFSSLHISLSGPGLDNLIFGGVILGIAGMVVAKVYHGVRREF